MLSRTIGERRAGYGASLERARDYIAAVTEKFDESRRSQIKFEDLGAEGLGAKNVIFELAGASTDIVLVGAHYDSAPGTPGANDNASGVAAALELARRLSGHRFVKTIRFVLFANEESPYFQSPGMGSLVHARGCRQRSEHVDAMLSLESLGYYSDQPGSQRYPWPIGSPPCLRRFPGSAGRTIGHSGSSTIQRSWSPTPPFTAIRIITRQMTFRQTSISSGLPTWRSDFKKSSNDSRVATRA